jgi:uncharacterized protein
VRTTTLVCALTMLIVALQPRFASGVPRAPDAGRVRAVVQQRLDESFGEGLFRVRRTERLETVAHSALDDPRDWLLVRYRGELRFMRAHRLSSWETLDLATLVPMLGSSARQVRGVNAAGNQQGDVLTVEGTLAFLLVDGAWQPSYAAARIDVSPSSSAHESSRETVEPLGARLAVQLETIGTAMAAEEDDGTGVRLEGDLEQLVADVECRLADGEGLLRLATGAPTTEYAALGRGLAQVFNEEEERLFLRMSTGSVNNVELLHAGLVDAAFVQNDIAHLAYHGQALFQGKLPMDELRAVGALFPEMVHVVTLAGSGIESVHDLAGCRVDVGPDNSGTRVNANQVLMLAGLSYTDLGGVQGTVPGDALDDLIAGRIQAAIMTGALPYPEIASRAWELPVRVLALDAGTVEEANDLPFIVPGTIPANTYPGQPAALQTLGVSAVLLVRQDMPDATVEGLLDALYSGQDRLGQHTVQAWYLSPDTADRGLPVPFHPAAQRYIEEARAGAR